VLFNSGFVEAGQVVLLEVINQAVTAADKDSLGVADGLVCSSFIA
jgi:hypothetical protein